MISDNARPHNPARNQIVDLAGLKPQHRLQHLVRMLA
jgi:hypothetical protein